MPRKDESRTVYTTESGRICPGCGKPESACTCHKKTAARSAGDGTVRILLEKKGRGGKTVSVITGLTGTDVELRELLSEMKRRCGTGGTIKDGVIEIQGDHRDALQDFLKSKSIKNVKRAGGD